MADVMHGGLTGVRMVSFITIVSVYNDCNMYCYSHVNQRRATAQESLSACWRPSIPYLTIIDP
jgi:hypothetical protein